MFIHKLKLYNIDTSWFSSYLNKRCQKKHYAGAISDKKEVISGVPQGSVIWPIFFLIYVNGLPLSSICTCADMFADDITIGISSHSIDTSVESLTTDLQNVLSWCNSNNMSLNVFKTRHIYYIYLICIICYYFNVTSPGH